MAEEQDKSHVLTSDCIITEIGRCEAGTMLSEHDVLPSTWQWLIDRSFLRSVQEIEEEADSDDPVGDSSPLSSGQNDSPTAGADEAPDAKKPAAGKARK